jgi:membrane-associated protease RseP (regulator of RpoE activity)
VRRTSPLVNLVLFVLTVASTVLAGAVEAHPEANLDELPYLLASGIPFSASVMAILGAHEMGHYIVARIHGVDSTLPFFIPMPLGPFGTLGAFIRIRSALPSRAAVFDIGAAGPFAGFIVGLPLLFWGFAHSTVITFPPGVEANEAWLCPFNLLVAVLDTHHFPARPNPQAILYGDSILTWLAVRLAHGKLPPHSDVAVGPLAFAGWIGMYVTSLNLIPIGQLDGGHIIYSLFGYRAERLSRIFSWALFGLGVFSSWVWFVWFALTRLLVGVRHPPPLDDAPLGPRRRLLAYAAIAILVLTLVPVPTNVAP